VHLAGEGPKAFISSVRQSPPLAVLPTCPAHGRRRTCASTRSLGAGLPWPGPLKLIIQIPCLNEAETLPRMLAELPREVSGVDEVEWLVIDDGSSDRTPEVAREGGVEHIVRLTNNKGLAAAFAAGLDACLKLGADVIVNTDADNQYPAEDIPRLVAPVVAGEADMVVGTRDMATVEHFSGAKKVLQRLGSWVVRRASGTGVKDTTSGFRAYNREAALQLQVVSDFTYTLESLIQAGKMLVAIDQVPVGANRPLRESRLFPSTWTYVRRNALAVFRAYAMYEPLRVFTIAAIVLAVAALGAWTPFLADWIVNGDSSGHIQSLILGAVLAIAAVQLFALGVIGDALAGQRVMTQRALERIRRVELNLGIPPSHYERGAYPAAPGREHDVADRSEIERIGA
jgi:glycosyltransferase involved in cell wall biosynthesis